MTFDRERQRARLVMPHQLPGHMFQDMAMTVTAKFGGKKLGFVDNRRATALETLQQSS